jgi:hypothetical protein
MKITVQRKDATFLIRVFATAIFQTLLNIKSNKYNYLEKMISRKKKMLSPFSEMKRKNEKKRKANEKQNRNQTGELGNWELGV